TGSARRRGGRSPADAAAGDRVHAELGCAETRWPGVAAPITAALRRVSDRAGPPLRAERHVLERSPGHTARPDPDVADLERAPLRPVLVGPALRAELCEASGRGARRIE